MYYVSHMCNVCSTMCNLIWLLMLDCPRLSPWSSPRLCLYFPWWSYISAVCHQLPTSPDLTFLPTPKSGSPLGCLIDIINPICPKLTYLQKLLYLLPSSVDGNCYLLASQEPSKCYPVSCIPHPMLWKGNPTISIFKIHQEVSRFLSLSFCCRACHEHLVLI